MQIYKIYINEAPLILAKTDDIEKFKLGSESYLFVRYSGGQKSIFQCIDVLEKGGPYDGIILHYPRLKELKSAVRSVFKIIKAGGGLVMNENGEALFIFRRGHWDLPKGKLDPGENYKTAAVREVIEETGIQGVIRKEKILRARHVYREKNGNRILKLTNFYLMSTKKQRLAPQIEEDIEKAVEISYYSQN